MSASQIPDIPSHLCVSEKVDVSGKALSDDSPFTIPEHLAAKGINLSPKILRDAITLHGMVVQQLEEIHNKKSYAFPLKIKCRHARTAPRKWSRRAEYKQCFFDPVAIEIVSEKLVQAGYHVQKQRNLVFPDILWGKLDDYVANNAMIIGVFFPIPIVTTMAILAVTAVFVPFYMTKRTIVIRTEYQ